ncbi:glycoside hydrolase family 28 protein [Piloderma croceum F 1598]|uniref:galacturonan 1,4-alpha-galacturonidase n=1 Tax=Piloderma croceum (strain F 1598) TaxID=765440 RepID=A0A0C3B7G9_PILCF|nr:glycoside hydrolase family 28 protein [Piloderma croceum F 1598]
MMVIKFVRCVLLDVILLACIVPAVSSSGSDFTSTVKRFPSISNLDGICTLTNSSGDDGPAFTAAILSDQCSTVNIPAGTTINIASPLNTSATYNKHISLAGTLSFTDDTTYWQQNSFKFTYQNATTFWLLGGKNISLYGGGTIQGNGQAWYNLYSTNSSVLRPIPLTIYEAINIVVRDITVLQTPFWNFFVSDSKKIVFDDITLHSTSTIAGIDAKNTDGWDIYRSDDVTITNSQITNQDDCVSFKPNSTNVLVQNLICNGSHGISVGSLGQYNGEFDLVENVSVSNIHMLNAQNGVRIKSWAGPNVGSGLVKNISYSHWQEDNVDNPIIIDSCFMTNTTTCTQYPSKVPTEDVYISYINGTSSGQEQSVVVNLNCSPGGTCSNIKLDNIALSPPAKYGLATYLCANIKVLGNAASLFNC